jgi:hypothetical protein
VVELNRNVACAIRRVERVKTLSLRNVKSRCEVRVPQNEVEWSGTQWSGVEWSGMEWNGVEWSGMEWNAVEWSGNGVDVRMEGLTQSRVNVVSGIV